MDFEKRILEAHSLESALSIFGDQRKVILRFLLSLDRDLWRAQINKNLWSVAQIVEHIIKLDRLWWFSFQFSKLYSRFVPFHRNLSITVLSSPFIGKKYKQFWWLPSPKGNRRRKHYLNSIDTFSQKLSYTCENLEPSISSRLLMYTPFLGFIGVVDAIMLLYYHDEHHFKQMQFVVQELTQN